MNRRLLSRCGVIAPVVFVFMAILGGTMRPDYSHFSDTVSELLTPGAPNKPLLDTLHTIFSVLLVLFGIGVLQSIRKGGQSTLGGRAGASMIIAMGLVSVLVATLFPQDPWGSPPTFTGRMHQSLSGVVGLLSMCAMVLVGNWSNRAGVFPGLRMHSWLTAGAAVLSAGFFVAKMGSPIMGLAERISILVGFQWMATLALRMSARVGNAGV